MSKGQFNLTNGVVSITGAAEQSLDRVMNTAAIRKAVFTVRTYQVSISGTLHLESSNQNVDTSTFLWKSLGSVSWTGSATDSNALSIVVGDEDELLSYVRWRYAHTSGTAATFEVTGYSLD